MRPTARLVGLFAAGVPISLFVNLAAPEFWAAPVAYGAAVILFALVDVANAIPRRAVEISLDAPSAIPVGEAAQLIVGLDIAPGGAPAPVEIALDVDELFTPVELKHADLAPDSRVIVEIPLSAKRRGIGRIESVWLRWRGRLGLVRFVVHHEFGANIPIVPNIIAVRRQALSLTSSEMLFGQKRHHRHGDGSEFDALRDWVPGLDRRWMDWKRSAHHRKLVCKEFQTERNHQIMLALDSGHLMAETVDAVPRLDHAINAGLLLAYASLRAGDRVGLFAFDSGVRQVLEPFGGPSQFSRLRHLTSEIAYSPDETNFTLGLAELTQRLTRRSLIVIQTEFVDTVTAELMLDTLARLARRHLVIFATQSDPDLLTISNDVPESIRDMTRTVIADDFLKEREVLFERLRRLGIQCIDAPAERLSAELLDRYVAVKRLELI